MISSEVILGFIGILATLAAGWQYTSKRKADTDKLAAEAQLKQVQVDAQIKIDEAKADLEERAFIREQLKAQIKINEQHQAERNLYEKRLAEKEAKNESNYRVVSDVQKDNGIQITNLVNAIKALNKSMVDYFEKLPGRITAGNTDTLKSFAKEMAAETGMVISQQFAIQNLDRELFPFPDPEDPAWREEWIKPTTPEPTIHKQPYFADTVKLQKPCAQIKAEGERVRIIRNRIKGWLVIDKAVDGTRCWGWLPEHTVEIGQPLSPPVSA